MHFFVKILYIFMRRRRASGTPYGKACSPRQSLRPQKHHPPHTHKAADSRRNQRFFYLLHVLLEISTSMGNISSRPASMSMISTALETSLYAP